MNIIITGCTGVGKSTIANKLIGEINAILINEPIDKNEFLTDSYYSPERYGTLSQISFMLSFSKCQDNWPVGKYDFLIQERTISDCLYIFAKNLFLRGKIEQREYSLIQSCHDYLIDKSKNRIDKYIFLTAPTKDLIERINSRGREFEKTIDEDFIDSQRKLYEDWFQREGDNVLRVENKDIETTIEIIKRWVMN